MNEGRGKNKTHNCHKKQKIVSYTFEVKNNSVITVQNLRFNSLSIFSWSFEVLPVYFSLFSFFQSKILLEFSPVTPISHNLANANCNTFRYRQTGVGRKSQCFCYCFYSLVIIGDLKIIMNKSYLYVQNIGGLSVGSLYIFLDGKIKQHNYSFIFCLNNDCMHRTAWVHGTMYV